MGPVARRCGAQVAAVKQLTGLPVALAAVLSAGGDGADRVFDLCPRLAR